MKYQAIICLFVLFATDTLISFSQQLDRESETIPDLFEAGVQYADNGDYEKAVQAWIQYAEGLDEPEYRVGNRLIKKATKHRLTDYYEKASVIYLNGLKASHINDEEKEMLLDELFCISGMLGQREQRRLRRSIEQGETEFMKFLYDFWNERTLTPSSDYNERLLEHWERVNFSIKNFHTSSNQQFDDRGIIYIRFGEPARKRSGIFLYNPGFANYVISARMEEGGGSGDAISDAINTTAYMNTLYRVIDYHTYPSYEVWIYTDLSAEPDNTVYLFGNNFGGNEMRLKQTVDDFVPSAAYSMGGRNSPITFSMMGSENAAGSGAGGAAGDDRESEFDVLFEDRQGSGGRSEIISPALVLQLMYYRQLASLDEFFGARYDDMLDRYMNTSMRLSSSTAREFQQLNAARTVINQRDVPEERTANTRGIHTIDTYVSAYRFLDENMEPYLRVFKNEDTENIITFEELIKRNDLDDVRFDDYEIIRTIRLLDEHRNQSGRVQITVPPLSEYTDPLTDNVIEIPYNGELVVLETHAELYDTSDENGMQISDNSTLPRSFRGSGSASATVQPFERHNDLFSSDIILGYTDESANRFVISHTREIPENSTIQFYYEAYNIPQNEDGLYSFNLRYKLTRERSTFGRIIRFGRESSTSMEIENTTDTSRFSQSLEIVTDQLRSGTYRLELILSTSNGESHEYSRVLNLKVY